MSKRTKTAAICAVVVAALAGLGIIGYLLSVGGSTSTTYYFGHKLTRPAVKVAGHTVQQAPPANYYTKITINYYGGGWYVVTNPASSTYTGTVAPPSTTSLAGGWTATPTPGLQRLEAAHCTCATTGGPSTPPATTPPPATGGASGTPLEKAIAAEQAKLLALDAGGADPSWTGPTSPADFTVICTPIGTSANGSEFTCTIKDNAGDSGGTSTVTVNNAGYFTGTEFPWTGPNTDFPGPGTNGVGVSGSISGSPSP